MQTPGIYQILDEMDPPEFRPNEVRDISARLDTIRQQAAEGDTEELRQELEQVFEAVNDLPESEERDRLRDEFIRLAESYGFEVSEEGDDD